MLHRNLMYLAGLVDPNLQNMLPVRIIRYITLFDEILKCGIVLDGRDQYENYGFQEYDPL